jgi:subtilisin family serine protease
LAQIEKILLSSSGRLVVNSIYFLPSANRTLLRPTGGNREIMKLRSRRPFVAAGLLVGVFGAAAVANAQDISDSAYQQIRALLLEKQSRTAVQHKLSASLVYASNAARGITTGNITDLGNPATSLHMGPQGALVRIKATVSPDLLNTIRQLGGRVIYSNAARGSIQARVPVNFIEPLAARGDVRAISATFPPKVTGSTLTSLLRRYRLPLSGIGRAAGQPYRFDPFLGLSFFIGSLTSQGFVTHGAREAAQTYGAKGAGIKVGILSDSAEFLPNLIGTGDLPPGTLNVADIDQVLNGGPGTSEGSAMMEIVYDLAPGVQLFFASAFNGEDSFADNIRLLRNTYHCDIIADDVSYSDEAAFQDGVIAQAVNDVTQDGALYFSSAGNSGNLTNGNSGTWEGDFNPAGAAGSPLPAGYTLHSFGANNFIRLGSSTIDITLGWSDPLGNSTNDYDLFILNAAGTAVRPDGSSTTVQSGPGSDPIEEVFTPNGFPANSRVVVVAKAGAQTRALHIGTFGGTLQGGTAGETHGHNAPAGCALTDPACPGRAFGVAAVAWNSARGALRAFVGGASNPTESFSSDGPRRMFYKADGTPITAGNLLFGTNGGVVLAKPDITAADGVTCRTPGFNPFYGTSAAAPHAAAVAALVKSARPSATGAQIFSALTGTALDIRAAGIDRDAGYGIVMAPAAVNAILH